MNSTQLTLLGFIASNARRGKRLALDHPETVNVSRQSAIVDFFQHIEDTIEQMKSAEHTWNEWTDGR